MALPPLSFQHTLSSSFFLQNLRHGDLLAAKVARVEPDGTALIHFSGGNITANPKYLLKAGDQVVVCVQKLPGRPAFALFPSLKENETIAATVVALRPEVLVRIGQAELLAHAQSEDALPHAGASVQVQLHVAAGKPILQLVVPERPNGGAHLLSCSSPPADPVVSAAAFDEMLQLLAPDKPMLQERLQCLLALLCNFPPHLLGESPWLDSLLKILEKILVDPKKNISGQGVASSLKTSGAFLESRLLQAAQASGHDQFIEDDLKLALLQVTRRLGTAEKAGQPPSHAQIREEITKLLDVVRAQQMVNIRLIPSRSLYFQLPMANACGIEFCEILISRHNERHVDKADAKKLLLTLAVSTTRMGKIRVTISIQNKSMNCEFKTSSREVAQLIEKNTGSLKRNLELLDYQVQSIGCVVTTDVRELSIAANLSSLECGGINICV